MRCGACAVALMALVAVLGCYTVALPAPPACSPGLLLQDVPLRLRKVCAALSTIYELSSAMESYLDDKGQVYNQMIRPESAVMGNDVKRQDVDHVFLRFGRRR